MSAIQVSLTSDFICPWCLIGERRLQAALTQLPEGVAVEMRWHPFQLNPTMPKAGLDRRAYRTAKFGSWEHSQALDAQVAAAGRGDGIAFNHAGILRTPNTLAAHRLMRLAAHEGDPTRLADRLFAGYFIEGHDLSDTGQLTALAIEAGLPEALSEKKADFSVTPWIYLLFIVVLVVEQMLAVHLSFHIRGGISSEAQLPTQVLRSQGVAG